MTRTLEIGLHACAALALVAGCGGQVETSPSGGAGGTSSATTGTTSAGGAGGGGGTVTHPDCAARGGACVAVASASEGCPEATYSPFSGSDALCSTAPTTRCCVPTGGLGSPCTLDAPCTGGGCLPEASLYPPGGFCTEVCDPASPACPDWAVCLPVYFSQAMGTCMLRCDHDGMCREGWRCEAFPMQPWSSTGETTNVCWAAVAGIQGLGGACTNDGDCLSTVCRPDPALGQHRCTASCDDAHPCLPSYACKPAAGCDTPGCGFCFE